MKNRVSVPTQTIPPDQISNLRLQLAAARKHAELARMRARTAKLALKLRRKAHKQAKRSAKEARKQFKALKKMLAALPKDPASTAAPESKANGPRRTTTRQGQPSGASTQATSARRKRLAHKNRKSAAPVLNASAGADPRLAPDAHRPPVTNLEGAAPGGVRPTTGAHRS